MLSTEERKKYKKSLLSTNSDMKKYDEIYQVFCNDGYSKELCREYSDTFIDNCKKPAVYDIIQASVLYRKIHDYRSSDYYLEILSDKKLSNEERYFYCREYLISSAMMGHWRIAEDFRTENINFIQTYMQKKKSPVQQADMYIALALVDCSSKHYTSAFRLLNFGYKPIGKNDESLLDILTTAVYIYAESGDQENLKMAVENANSCLKLFSDFPHSWSKSYYENRIIDAANGII